MFVFRFSLGAWPDAGVICFEKLVKASFVCLLCFLNQEEESAALGGVDEILCAGHVARDSKGDRPFRDSVNGVHHRMG